jgi:hypothetical protein
MHHFERQLATIGFDDRHILALRNRMVFEMEQSLVISGARCIGKGPATSFADYNARLIWLAQPEPPDNRPFAGIMKVVRRNRRSENHIRRRGW